MHIRYAKLVCDKCGKEVEMDPSIEHPFSSSFVQSEQPYRDWGMVKGKHLCDSCYPAYVKARKDMESELDARFGL